MSTFFVVILATFCYNFRVNIFVVLLALLLVFIKISVILLCCQWHDWL